MQRALLLATTVLAASMVSLSCGISALTHAADAAKDEPKIAVSYSVGELPVWSKDGKSFEPTVLMTLLREKLGADNWRWRDAKHQALIANDKSSIVAYAPNQSLVVNAAEADHKEVRRLLTSLRTGAQ